MVSVLHKFRHYMLNNKFIFYVNHMALVYLVNKPHVFGRLAKWILLFLEYNFKISHKLCRSHLMVDALSRLPNQIELLEYFIKLVMLTCSHYNLSGYKIFMSTYIEGVMPKRFTTSQRQYLAKKAKPFVLQEGILYRFGQNKFC